MATPVEMPKLGNTVEECLLARWLKRTGERVASGEVIAEIETDKATFDLTAPTDGTLLAAFFGEGEVIPVFANIGVIGEPGESVEEYRPRAVQQAPAATPEPAIAAPAVPMAPAVVPREAAVSPRAGGFAAEHGFFPRGIAGSGPGGRILERDLAEMYSRSPRVAVAPGRDLGRPVKLSAVRERIARRMRESLALSAQYTLNASADATALLRLRARIKAARESRGVADVNLNDMVMFCAVRALVEMPELNAEMVDGELYQHESVNLSFACETPRGLLAPVIKGAEKLDLAGLAAEVGRLAQQAEQGSVSPDDLTGGTFTVSNLGSLGIESFTPILNPPQVALLGVTAIELKPVRRESGVEFVEHIGLSLTCDHQVIDGAMGARFLKLLRERIEKIEFASGLEV